MSALAAQACRGSAVDAGAEPGSPIPGPRSRPSGPRSPSFAVLTFGCRVNQADSFDIERVLRARGASEAPPDTADLVVVNTCSVTGASDQGARQAIRRIARENPAARVVVTGCYATRSPDELGSLPNVVGVVSNALKASMAAAIDDAFGLSATEGVGAAEGPCGQAPGAMGRTAIPLRVQTGCDEPCAFCIIPSTRGPSRSRPLDDVVAEARRLVGAGYREVWLVGVHLGAYGRDLPDRPSLVDLARALDRVPQDVTFRLSSLEPLNCTPDLLELVATSDRFAPHVHLPLQHGSDRVLRLMRRPYSAAYFDGLVRNIASRLPDASIGTDVMVGFPGETAEDARATADVLDRLPLSYVHVFPYSDRPGTEASRLWPKVDGAVIRARAAELRGIGRRKAVGFAARQIGSVRSGLTLEDGTIVLTDNYVKVRIPPGLPRNTRVRVRIDRAAPDLAGDVVSPGDCR